MEVLANVFEQNSCGHMTISFGALTRRGTYVVIWGDAVAAAVAAADAAVGFVVAAAVVATDTDTTVTIVVDAATAIPAVVGAGRTEGCT